MKEKFASISIDIDTIQTLLGTDDISFDSIYEKAIPRYLDLMSELEIKTTLFVVGKDLKNKNVRTIIQTAKNLGHEIASHSYSHFQGFRFLNLEEQKKDISDSKKILEDTIQDTIYGFRAPGWNISMDSIKILSELGFLYDSSIFPSSLNPLLKIMHYTSTRNVDDKRKRTTLGDLGNMFSKREAYSIPFESSEIVEIPITVTPFFRVPFFGTFNFMTGNSIFNLSYYFINKTTKHINYELHGVEFADYSKDNIDAEVLDNASGKYLPHTLEIPLITKNLFLKSMITKYKLDRKMITLKEYSEKIKNDF